MNDRDQTSDDTDATAAQVDLLTDDLASWVRFHLLDMKRKPLAIAMALMKTAAEVIWHDDGDVVDIVKVASAAASRVAKIHNDGECKAVH